MTEEEQSPEAVGYLLLETITKLKEKAFIDFYNQLTVIRQKGVADKDDFDRLARFLDTAYWSELSMYRDSLILPFLPETQVLGGIAAELIQERILVQTRRELRGIERAVKRLEWRQSESYRYAHVLALAGFIGWVALLLFFIVSDFSMSLRIAIAIGYPIIGIAIGTGWKIVDRKH